MIITGGRIALVRRQVLEMHIRKVDDAKRTAVSSGASYLRPVPGHQPALPGPLDGLLQTLLDLLVVRVEVKCPSILEGEFKLYGCKGSRNPTARDRLDDCIPYIGAEEGCGNVGVYEVQQGRGEGLKLLCRLRGEVDDL